MADVQIIFILNFPRLFSTSNGPAIPLSDIPNLTWSIPRRAKYDDWIKLRPGFDQSTTMSLYQLHQTLEGFESRYACHLLLEILFCIIILFSLQCYHNPISRIVLH
ncbi:hypothetical protein F2P79_024109, partial [Pimephales promelas]